ncbi:hypothetical protein BJF93_14040 [Xaviernesmea oryzae]|uniref:Uncharacterized protein n=2 Tax=Xaviernesmea oryzae TaxID=464029 RepID=A0A1Q9ARE4_9HYPH|nr:hypothetical protein [Xaviernesmea oryzae]OLP57949.1 hypothetical protein BJF93_14040 [Xaviernesmea oryzae]SEL29381.1 hypothetical protein SAMN04487976_10755 [Xaviernesmea oryzae]
MTETYSKTRQQAEIAFGKTQTQAVARERAFEELDSIAVARDEKTRRLRDARLARDQQDTASRPGAKRASKR